MQRCDWCANQSWCSTLQHYECIMKDYLYYTPETPAEERASNYPKPSNRKGQTQMTEYCTWPTHWALIGFEYEDAKRIMQVIVRVSRKQVFCQCLGRRDMFVDFEDGTRLRWFPAHFYPRMYRFGKMWCDRHIDEDAFRSACACYYGRLDGIIWI